MPRRSRDRLRRLALLTPSCGGQGADREEKRVTYGNGRRHEEQLDTKHPNQRGHLERDIFKSKKTYQGRFEANSA